MSGFGPGTAAWKLAFQLSPIILSNGVANFMPGKILPIMAITEAINFPLGLLSGGENIELDDFFANYTPLAGAKPISNRIGKYPFANQAVAANSIIAQPLNISFRMVAPAKGPLGYFIKLPIMTALIETLKSHNQQGGTYILATPSYIFTNAIMLDMTDVSGGETAQVQHSWQFDFERPLITLDDAANAENALITLIKSAVQLPSQAGALAWSGLQAAGSTLTGTLGPALIPAASSTVPAASAAAASAFAAFPGT